MLSGGERARVGLILGTLSRRKIILLDEPLAGLDESRKAAALRLISDWANRAVIFVSDHSNSFCHQRRGVVLPDCHDV